MISIRFTPPKQFAKQKNNPLPKGFTIIEVVLVLTIAGLIFLMVFIALPALQRSQRDAQRKQDMARVITAVEQRRMNNRGRVTTGFGQYQVVLRQEYLEAGGDIWADPDGSEYFFVDDTVSPGLPGQLSRKSSTTGDTLVYLYSRYSSCRGEEIVQDSSKRDSVAIRIVLESVGVYCINN